MHLKSKGATIKLRKPKRIGGGILFNQKLFRIILLEKGISLKDIAKMLNISLVTLYRKMNGYSDFFRDEVRAICNYLNLSLEEREDIFFAPDITEAQKK